MLNFTQVTYQNQEITDQETFDRLPDDLKAFLKQINGIIAFNGGLQIKGCIHDLRWNSLRDVWFGDSCLYKTYECLTESDIPFAQDAFGDQFILRANIVHKLNAEFGELDNLELSLNAFLEKAVADPIGFLSLEPLQDLFEMNIRLENGQLMNVYPPFMFKSEGNRSFKPISAIEQIDFLKNLYEQTKNLGDGEQVRFKIVD